ncbi:MAG: hypothetical protein NT084_12530 [Bacteroidetes bacterium]|nr:hypothetical protein [Bacteroidota bacterium]
MLTLNGPETGGGAFSVAHGGLIQPAAALVNPAPNSWPVAFIVIVCGFPLERKSKSVAESVKFTNAPA